MTTSCPVTCSLNPILSTLFHTVSYICVCYDQSISIEWSSTFHLQKHLSLRNPCLILITNLLLNTDLFFSPLTPMQDHGLCSSCCTAFISSNKWSPRYQPVWLLAHAFCGTCFPCSHWSFTQSQREGCVFCAPSLLAAWCMLPLTVWITISSFQLFATWELETVLWPASHCALSIDFTTW